MTHDNWVSTPTALRAHGINHNNDCFIIRIISDKNRHGRLSAQFTASFSSVTGNHLVSTLGSRSYQCRSQNTISFNTLYGFRHFFIIIYMKRMIFKGIELCQIYFHNLVHTLFRCFL